MAKYAKNSLKKKSALSMVAGRSEKYSADITQDVKVEDLTEAQKGRLRFLKDEQLIDDPDNIKTYGQYEIENLTEVMKEYGFQGVILAYPIGNDKYQIESGHRRRVAGRRAGIKEFPVLETIPPATDYERKRRLFGANLLSRDSTPMINAKVADNLYYTFKDEYEYKKNNNLLEKDENGTIIESGDIMKKVSLFMGYDVRTINKYRTLLNLVPELQNLADSKKYSWTALTDAATLSVEKQKELASDILNNPETATKNWIVKKCRSMKEQEINEVNNINREDNFPVANVNSPAEESLFPINNFSSEMESENNYEVADSEKNDGSVSSVNKSSLDSRPENISAEIPPEQVKQPRSVGYLKPKYAPKKILKFSSDLTEVLKEEYVIPQEDVASTLLTLENLNDIISKKIKELKERKD